MYDSIVSRTVVTCHITFLIPNNKLILNLVLIAHFFNNFNAIYILLDELPTILMKKFLYKT